MKLIDIIEVFIAGDWGEETYSKETPCAVTCVRGADIIPISEYDFSAIPVRYINQQAYAKKCRCGGGARRRRAAARRSSP